MSGNTTGQVLGAATTGAGAALLPNTFGSDHTVLAVVGAVALGAIAISLLVSAVYKKSL